MKRLTMNTNPITTEELIEVFGDSVSLEVASILHNGMTPISTRQLLNEYLDNRQQSNPVIDSMAMRIWAAHRGVKTGIEARWANFADQPEGMHWRQVALAAYDVVSENASTTLDARRYRWLRADHAYAPEENFVRGGQELDQLCDAGLRGEM